VCSDPGRRTSRDLKRSPGARAWLRSVMGCSIRVNEKRPGTKPGGSADMSQVSGPRPRLSLVQGPHWVPRVADGTRSWSSHKTRMDVLNGLSQRTFEIDLGWLTGLLRRELNHVLFSVFTRRVHHHQFLMCMPWVESPGNRLPPRSTRGCVAPSEHWRTCFNHRCAEVANGCATGLFGLVQATGQLPGTILDQRILLMGPIAAQPGWRAEICLLA
jgi:hypothetical protein